MTNSEQYGIYPTANSSESAISFRRMKRSPIRILLVEDHQMMRDGLRLALAQKPNMQVIGEAGDGATALRRAEQLRPDVVVMDIGLPDGDGIEFSRKILQISPDTRIVILSATVDQESLDRAMEAGVSGYLSKMSALDDLARAISSARRKEIFLSQEVSAILAKGYQQLRQTRQTNSQEILSERERQVLQAIAEGRNTKEIAAEIGLSPKTVETYRARVMTKLGVHSVAELTKYAIRMGYTKA